MRMTSTVKWFNHTKGLGFITREGGQMNYFVDRSAIQTPSLASLTEGDWVEFDIVQGEKRPSAENVVKLGR